MSRSFLAAIAAWLVIAVSGCAPVLPRWQQEAMVMLEAVRLGGADKDFPVEYGNALETYRHGESLQQRDEVEGAEDYFLFALTKAKLLEKGIAEEKLRRAEEERRRIREEQLELERQRSLLEEQRRAEQELAEAAQVKEKAETVKLPRERPLPSHHTVKRGETLPQIAARSDVYNDYRLWPLLYRANRDQIRDPRHVWPGQVLRIPRNVSREDIAEARRYAQERPI
ncbi:MAG: LysM peptidoglycan-binding domain-containing protein [Geobacteraceae bacterium]|nr:LysM peptidoglycan-binding domain-containing protein [Geobacteraceae bacterium]